LLLGFTVVTCHWDVRLGVVVEAGRRGRHGRTVEFWIIEDIVDKNRKFYVQGGLDKRFVICSSNVSLANTPQAMLQRIQGLEVFKDTR